jgi:hypothetical protein
MAEQTAVDWLFEQIPVEWTSTKYAFDAYKQAKEMEKDQIKTAYKSDRQPCSDDDADQYYNETFGK